jgi:enamine deaminase RidA (YjgF/YER057c/UK114 family)
VSGSGGQERSDTGKVSGGQERSDPGKGTWSARLADLGIELPEVVAPLAAYVPAVRTGNLVYTSGQLPMMSGELPLAGKVGASVSPEQAKSLARQCALNALAAVHLLVGIDSVVRVVKVVGFVASAPGFNGQPSVVNGASELFGQVFGESGQHARSAVGVSELPLDAPVEVEVIVEVA